jgi:predicted transposase YbfD/YdcC
MNETIMVSSLVSCFAAVPDPRVVGRTKHKLLDILVMSVLAVISGSEDWEGIADYCEAKSDWLSSFLSLEHGIPSHDTFNRVFQLLDAEAWENAFRSWISQAFKIEDGNIINLDGKTLRGSKDSKLGKRAIHMVSAFASEQELVLGQLATEEKSNEITAIPALLKTLDISACLVTIDAMGCQKEIAGLIVERQGDYFIGVKKNQAKLYENISWLFDYAAKEGHLRSAVQSFDATHGRYDTRRCSVFEYDGFLEDSAWPGLAFIVMIERELEDPRTAKVKKQKRYYITSDPSCTPEKALRTSRLHWDIENLLHWTLDVTFKEDHSRARLKHAALNLSVLRRMVINMLRKVDSPKKLSLKRKRFKALMDNAYALKVLNAI